MEMTPNPYVFPFYIVTENSVMFCMSVTECLSEMPVHYYMQHMEQKGEIGDPHPVAKLRSY